MTASWLENLKPGDKVVLSRGLGTHWLNTVERVTKTLIILANGSRYRKKDGQLAGESMFGHSQLVQVNPLIAAQMRRQRLIYAITHAKPERFGTLSNDELEAFLRTLKAP
jgi:hypothetical protein